MDNLTHTLTAVALSQAGLNRKTRFATLTLILGSNLPDIDFVSMLGGAATCLKYHRGITHSILGGAVLASVLGAAVYFLGRKSAPKKAAPPLDLRWLLAAAWIAVGSHILMDFTNSYGVRPFLPFSGRWYAWDIMFIVDPLLLVLLAAGLTLPALFRLITEEVVRRKPASVAARFSASARCSRCGGFATWPIAACWDFSIPTLTARKTRFAFALPRPTQPVFVDRSCGDGFRLPHAHRQRLRFRCGRGAHHHISQT